MRPGEETEVEDWRGEEMGRAGVYRRIFFRRGGGGRVPFASRVRAILVVLIEVWVWVWVIWVTDR